VRFLPLILYSPVLITFHQSSRTITELVQQALSRTAQSISSRFATSNPPKATELPDQTYVLGMSLGNSHQGTFDSNFWAFQKSYDSQGGWDVLYEQGDFTEDDDDDELQPVDEGKRTVIDQALIKLEQVYAARFERALPLPEALSTPELRRFAQDVTSNVLGGVGYFAGRSLVDRSFAHEYDEQPEFEPGEEGPRETEERELLTATPSRSFFPRGFYWDEGFHLLIVGALDNDLRCGLALPEQDESIFCESSQLTEHTPPASLEILKSWVDLIDEDGWVGREQILGEEARSKVRAPCPLVCLAGRLAGLMGYFGPPG
jgi:mannosyl-oligosaccharide glucosidase